MDAAVAPLTPPPGLSVEPQAAAVPEREAPRGIPTPALAAYAPPSAPEPAPRHYEPPPASFTPPPSFTQAPLRQDSGDAAAGQFPFGAPPTYPEPTAPYEARGEFPEASAAVASPSVPMQGFPQQQPFSQMPAAHAQGAAAYGFGASIADPAQNNYRLLESLGRPGELPGQVPQPPSHLPQGPTGTFGSMSSMEAAAAMQSFGQPAAQQSGFQHPGYGQFGHGQTGFSPPALPATSTWPSPVSTSALLPAAMVTLPLAEVMRLVAVGAPVASSPFAAFRVSGGVSNSR
ncbi:MAG: hypothetical protein EON47_00950 [Acetobacteraceae bacterium]|nr:MAG: hypothetical protein EON47_00950 [Acetobacteraceae bacterium]